MTNPLRRYAHNVTSSDGEDGIIEKIFEIVGTRNRWCVELGALNGMHDSNTRNIITEHGWSAVLIEGDITYFKKLQDLYREVPGVHPVRVFISFEGDAMLDRVLAATPIPKDFDLFVLDIDGNDYHVWDSLVQYRPRVVCVEFNPTIPNDISFVQPRDMHVQQGSSLRAIADLARRKGYRLIATTDANAFFVVAEEWEKFQLADDSLDHLHPTSPYYSRLYQLYDGTLILDGYAKLMWHNIPIDERLLQVLPRHRRRYQAHLSPSSAVRSLKFIARKLPLHALWLKMKGLLR